MSRRHEQARFGGEGGHSKSRCSNSPTEGATPPRTLPMKGIHPLQNPCSNPTLSLLVRGRCYSLWYDFGLVEAVAMAERVGFEPTVELPRQQFSRLPDSAALAPLRDCPLNAGGMVSNDFSESIR